MSLLSWERGLKYIISNVDLKAVPYVAPLVGAWIEIKININFKKRGA